VRDGHCRFKGKGSHSRADPVFYDDDCPLDIDEDDEAGARIVQSHEVAKQEWDRLQKTLKEDDFPMRIAFLDKSGSMGCDEITYEALQLGIHNCLHPQTGSTLTFLFAGPGETQIFLRRPGDKELAFNVRLGSATWFNEPILRTLTFLAPLIENLDTHSWMAQHGQPPLQVLCMTDGQDNCSPQGLNSLGKLVREIKDIKGPEKQQTIFAPITGPLAKNKNVIDMGKVPVWMAWIAVGMGGQQLLMDKSVPKEICLVDAVVAPRLRDELPELEEGLAEELPEEEDLPCGAGGQPSGKMPSHQRGTAASRARKRATGLGVSEQLADFADALSSDVDPAWRIGHRVRVRSPEPGRAPKSGLVLEVMKEEGQPFYRLLLDDESEITVAESQIMGRAAEPKSLLAVPRRAGASVRGFGLSKSSGLLARTADADMQRLQVLSVVDTVTTSLESIFRGGDVKAGPIGLEGVVAGIHGSEELSPEQTAHLEEKLQQSSQKLIAATVEPTPVEPTQAILETLQHVGLSASRMLPEDRLVAQRLVAVGLEMLICGGSLMPDYLIDQLGHFAGVTAEKALRRLPEEGDAWSWELAKPLQQLLQLLLQLGLLEKSKEDGSPVLQAKSEAKPCLASLRRVFDPSATRAGVEDAIRRSVNRHQRLKPQFQFASRSRRASERPLNLEQAESPPLRPSSSSTMLPPVIRSSSKASSEGSNSPGSARLVGDIGLTPKSLSALLPRSSLSTRSSSRAASNSRAASKPSSPAFASRGSAALQASASRILGIGQRP